MCSHAKTPKLDIGSKDAVIHPLDPITAKEVKSMKEIVGEAGYAGPNFRYSYVMLREPDHKTLGVWQPGDDVPREIGVLVLDKTNNVAREMVVDIPAHQVIHNRQLNPATDGWGPILDEDYVAAETIAKADPGYVAALAKRGITDLTIVRCLPLSAGVFGYEAEVDRRMIRVLSFLATENTHSMFSHPVDGVVAHPPPRSALRLCFVLEQTSWPHYCPAPAAAANGVASEGRRIERPILIFSL